MTKLIVWQDASLEQAAITLANSTKSNASRPRLVIVTQGPEHTLVASSNPTSSSTNIQPGESNPKTFDVPKLASDKIVDTNGAGDMFAGGFLGALALGKSLQESIDIGHKLGQMCCGQIGPKLSWPKEQVV